jgi:predicted NBD/HSP70 family sugar kinase
MAFEGLLHIINIVNPELVIIGGSVGGIFPYVVSDVDAILRSELLSELQMPKIELSHFGAEGPALGAALLLHQRMFSVDERAFYPDGGARGLFRIASV